LCLLVEVDAVIVGRGKKYHKKIHADKNTVTSFYQKTTSNGRGEVYGGYWGIGGGVGWGIGG
jgi:hypothetical protein